MSHIFKGSAGDQPDRKLEVFYEDTQIIVINKPAGIASEATHGEQSSLLFSVPALLCSTWNNLNAYVGVVHRLDVGVSGVMVYAKTPTAAANLSRQILASHEAYNKKDYSKVELENNGSILKKKDFPHISQDAKNFSAPCFIKEYRAVVAGDVDEAMPQTGLLRDYLFKDSRKGRVFVVERPRKGVREAVLEYTVLGHAEIPAKTATRELEHAEHPPAHPINCNQSKPTCSLVSITLHTGRTHQIRVQFASRKHPLWGDGKYGSRQKGALALQCARLQFLHPETGEKMEFTAPMPDELPFTLFQI